MHLEKHLRPPMAPSTHGASECPLFGDPGTIDEAPFFLQPETSSWSFLSMRDGSAWSRGCPPLLGLPGAQLAPGCFTPPLCIGRGESLRSFFGPGSDGPAVWSVRPDLQGAEPPRKLPTK